MLRALRVWLPIQLKVAKALAFMGTLFLRRGTCGVFTAMAYVAIECVPLCPAFPGFRVQRPPRAPLCSPRPGGGGSLGGMATLRCLISR